MDVRVEIANDDSERERGLMFRDHLDPKSGMLFVFPEERPLAFWMKNTLMPLDILYFDAEGNLVSVTTMTPCSGDPCPLYPSAATARYALEVPAGFGENHGIGPGWRMSPRLIAP